jgi:hypothetical protein
MGLFIDGSPTGTRLLHILGIIVQTLMLDQDKVVQGCQQRPKLCSSRAASFMPAPPISVMRIGYAR